MHVDASAPTTTEEVPRTVPLQLVAEIKEEDVEVEAEGNVVDPIPILE